MRRLLGLLRADGEATASLEPPPTLDSLDELVEAVRRSGVSVELRVDGEQQPMSPGLELTAYRVVQESLTNVLRHAGPARACVHIEHGRRELRLEIADDGHLPPPGAGLGRGLLGLRERVRVYDGAFSAGRDGGLWVVRAILPLDRVAWT